MSHAYSIPKDFDVNGIKIIANFFNEEFEDLPNELGGSDADKAKRQSIDSKINKKESSFTLKKLIGKMGHFFLQQRECLIALIKDIYEQTGIAVKWVKVEAYTRKCLKCGFEDKHKDEDRPRLDECPNCGYKYWGRYHVDILTDKYAVEIKFSLMYVRDFERQISAKYSKQTNYYLGGLGVDLGFVWYFNIAAFKNKFTSWDAVWLKNGYCIPMKFDAIQYKRTIDKFVDVFECVEAKDYDVPCPSSFTWECNHCDFDECPNPILYVEVGPDEPFCSYCRHKIKQDPSTIKKTVPAFKRNGKLYCKSETCTQAVIDAWEYQK